MSTNYYWLPEEGTLAALRSAQTVLAASDDPYARLVVQSFQDYLAACPHNVDDDNPAIHIGRYSNGLYHTTEGREVLVLNSNARSHFRWTRSEHRERLVALRQTDPHRVVLVDEYGQEFTAARFFDTVLCDSPTEVLSPGRWS